GREVVQVLTRIPFGVESGWHTHPGEEVGYILAGTVELAIEGRTPVVLQAGEGFLVPPRTPHNARDLGPGTGQMLSTYIVAVRGQSGSSPSRRSGRRSSTEADPSAEARAGGGCPALDQHSCTPAPSTRSSSVATITVTRVCSPRSDSARSSALRTAAGDPRTD